MLSRVSSLLRVTAVRLSIIYTLIFGLLAIGIVFYMTGATVNVIREQYQTSIDQELTGLSRIYRRGGINSLIRTLERRARAPGANLYVIANPQGEIVAGNVPRLQSGIMSRTGWTSAAFKYERYDAEDDREHRAIARVLEMPNGMRILVGRDIGEYEGFRNVVGQAFKLALGTMVALGLLTWFFVGRRALRRIDRVSKSSMLIMGGDRSERLPVTGANDEFDRLSENLNHMLDRITHLDDGLKQMSDNIAHDLKTPITRLRNKAEEALSSGDDASAQQNKIEEIIEDCDRIVKTFDALLTISRVESGATVAKMDRMNPVELLADVYELYEAVAEEEQCELTLQESPKKDVIIKGNRELLSQALSNLIDNALKYGGNEITLSLEFENNLIKMIIADNGRGIEKEDREKVKGRFVRLDKSRNQPGNGLGLALVNAIANLHSGRLLIEDNNPGLRVILEIPQLDQSDAS